MKAAKTLCLNMIVKNEMANLERCLSAVAPYIACWVIGDTGSTDGTQDFIRSFFDARNIPGELHSFPFVDFAQARNEALDRARASKLCFDYLLLTDADMELTVQEPAFAQNLTSAAYKVLQRTGVTYWNNRLLRRDVPASYKGVTHEYLDVRSGETRELAGISFIDHGTGANRVDKYERDVRLLTNAIEAESDPGLIARYTFYLANTLRDSGEKEAALDTYLKRSRLGHWQQEVFMSLLNAAKLKEALEYSNDEVISAYAEATAACPTRAEALHGVARFCRDKGIYEQGYEAAAKGLTITYPNNALFIHDWIYEYGLLDEFAINAYWTGRYAECVEACDRLLHEGKLPADKWDRVQKNKDLAVEKLREAAALSSPDIDPFVKLLRAARQKADSGASDEEVIAVFMEAAAARLTRAEALHGAARFSRSKGLYERGYEAAAKGLAIPYPSGAPLVEDWIYDYGLLDEFAITAYWTGRYAECVEACDRLLTEGKLPEDKRDRVQKNKGFALEKLREAASSSAETDEFVKLLRAARQKEELGRPDEEVIAAYTKATAACPTRAEALHGAARFCRNKRLYERACAFAAQGLAIPYPKGAPSVEDWIYEYGLQEEYSIAANYARDPVVKDRGFAACNWLALNREIPEGPRNLAMSNLHFYLEPASKLMPSFAARQVGFEAPSGYRAMNPSVARQGDQLVLVQRTVNYTIDHAFPDGDDRRYVTQDGEPISTRNFLLRLGGNLAIRSSSEILPPEDMPEPACQLARGFEDLRPFAWDDALWCVAGVRELTREGWYEQVLARIDQHTETACRLTDWRVLSPKGLKRHEKNWMPRVAGAEMRFVYLCDPTRLVDNEARTITEIVAPIQAEDFRGGSQLIAFDGGSLALVHQARVRDGQRHYRHRFVWFDDACRLRGVSRPFFFVRRGVEFAAGLAWHPDSKRLIITYGVDDCEAWIATVEAEDIRRRLEDAERLPSGVQTALVGRNAKAVAKSRVNFSDTVAATFVAQSEPPLSRTGGASNWPIHLIVGVPRSGTTLFRAILGAHPRICAPSETPWLTGAYAGVPSLRELLRHLVAGTDGPVKNIRGVSESDVTRAATSFLFELFFSKMSYEGKDILVLKTPDDIWFVDELLEFFPRCKILHIRRDVRDVALSTINTTDWKILNHFGENTFQNAVTRWIACERKIADLAKTNANIVSFRFEDLVTQTEVELDRAVKFLGVSFDEQMMDYARHLGDAPGWEVGSRDVKRHGSVKASRAWAHRSVEPTVEERRIIELNATHIEALGYARGWQRETDPPAPSAGAVRSALKIQVTPTSPQVAAAEHNTDETTDGIFEQRIPAITSTKMGPETPSPRISADAKTPDEKFFSFAPFLRAADRPKERREQSRKSDAAIAPFLNGGAAALPQIHCFYEVMSETAKHPSLIAATQSMRAVGHPVRVWSYAPQKLDFLTAYGVELRDAADVVPKSLFERIVAGSEIRFFSDIFRYAALYEHGGLWMDTDVVMLRPFPFRGDHFFNLQWRHGGQGHFVCGNVMYAEPYSHHMRNLYEQALERSFAASGNTFGDVGPKLLSDYIVSEEGAPLQKWLFSPMFFNALDWTEVDQFNRPVADLADYLNDPRVIGIHLWNARTHSATRADDRSLIAMLSNPHERMPSFTALADRFNTDKNRQTGNRHCYARIYDRLLGKDRFALRRLMEIGLCRPFGEQQSETPSVALWQSYFPFCHVVGVDLTDFSRFNNERFTSFICDQSARDELRAVASRLEPGSFDVIIDDGSHASADEQLTLFEFWPLLADGGWYFIEDLDWQPPGEDRATIALTKTLLREIQENGVALSIDPLGVSALAAQFAEILFFDSHYELTRAHLMGGLVAIRKRGGGS